MTIKTVSNEKTSTIVTPFGTKKRTETITKTNTQIENTAISKHLIMCIPIVETLNVTNISFSLYLKLNKWPLYF